MYAQELQAFKERHKIKSADAWAETTGVSKSTIVRGLKGEGKDIGVNTLLMLIKPYGETLDQLLNMGAYSPEEIAKNEIAEKIEGVIDEIENSPVIPEAPAEEIVEVLSEAHEFITNTPTEEKCSACDVLREMIAVLTEDKETKNKWIVNSFKVCFVLLVIVFSMIVIDGILIMSIINMAK
jgi:hypothetical protein